jgi:hypothetical protein
MSQDLQQAISHVLQQDSHVIDGILAKLKQLHQIQNILHCYLDKKLAPHCVVANFENHTALWATQLRFQIPNLLTQLRQHDELAKLQEIRCKIRPKQPLPPEIEYPQQERLSLETSKILLETAKSIKHSSLKEIMEKIAQNT